MKYLCTLPDRKYYRPLPCDRVDRWQWADIDSDKIIIDSRLPDPWNLEQLCVRVGWKKSSGHGGDRTVKGAKLLVFDPEENPDAVHFRLYREVYPSELAYTEYDPKIVEFFSVKLPSEKNVATRQLSYSFRNLTGI